MNEIKESLSEEIKIELVERLLKRYTKLKRNYDLRKYEECLESVGKFIEIMLRVLEFITKNQYTSFDKKVSLNKSIEKLEQLPKNEYPESIRIMIPRTLYTLYTFRSKRGGAHVKDITPYYIDATYIIHSTDWIISEMLRVYHDEEINQEKVNAIVDKKVPPIEKIQGDFVILNNELSTPNKILLVLYENHPDFIETKKLKKWINSSNSNILVALSRLDKSSKIYRKEGKNRITKKGIEIVENQLEEIYV